MPLTAAGNTAVADRPASVPGSRGMPPAMQSWVIDAQAVLRCPVSGTDLRLADADELAALNARVADGTLRCRDGSAVPRALEAALLTDDGRWAYAIVDGIVILTETQAIVARGADHAETTHLRAEKRDAQAFYDAHGWQPQDDASEDFVDAALHEDMRPVSREYLRQCNRRVMQHIPPCGKYLLDVASGPLQFPEYVEYSEGYTHRVCVDLSLVALRAARRRLGGRGIFVLGDVTNLPLKDGTMDGVVSIHTLFHVPQDEQPKALRELHRVLRPGGSAVVVYSAGDRCALMKLPLLRFGLLRPLQRRLRWYGRRLRQMLGGPSATGGTPPPRLYFHAHPVSWWRRQRLGFEIELRCWRSVHVDFLKMYVHRWLAGRAVVGLLYWLENAAPRLMGSVGQYPMFVVRKVRGTLRGE
ncbi:MAG: class I SAM-dependent methyltransferase [Phycisphaerae bacterium]|jgi:SAM-dependent methyltransferase